MTPSSSQLDATFKSELTKRIGEKLFSVWQPVFINLFANIESGGHLFPVAPKVKPLFKLLFLLFSEDVSGGYFILNIHSYVHFKFERK